MPKFKAKLSKAEYEKLSEAERGNYVQLSGTDGYVFDLEAVDGFAVEDIRGLVSAKDALRAEKAELERKLKAGGPSAEVSAELAAVKAELEQLKALDPKGKAEARVAEVERNWKSKLDSEQATWNAEKSRYQREIDKRVRRAELAAALAEKKARTDRLEKLVTLNEGRVKVIQLEDGSFSTQVVNADGTPAYSNRMGRRTDLMTLDEVAEEAMKELPEFFEGHKANGTGGGSAVGGSGGTFTMSKREALDNPALYEARKAQAQAAGQQITLTA